MKLARDEIAWLRIAPLTLPYAASFAALGWLIQAGEPRPIRDVGCPRCGFESLLILPILAARPGYLGREIIALPPAFSCVRCYDSYSDTAR